MTVTASALLASRPRAPSAPVAAVLLLAVGVLTRAPTFGNPVLGFDEQFYLVVADRMAHGAIPYVDIFDRKPIGLFLIFRAALSSGLNGALAYQLVALAFASATAFVVVVLARRYAGGRAALSGGVLYLCWLAFVEGDGGQAQVFMNLPMALAALGVASAREQPSARLGVRGIAPMLLAGAALQIKYTALFEAAAFGLALIWFARAGGRSRPAVLRLALLWATVGLAPTLAAWAAYAAIGQSHAFLFANFISAFGRLPDPPGVAWRGAALIAIILLPLVALAAAASPAQHARARADRLLVRVWAVVAVAGLIAWGSFAAPQYALGALVPLSVAAAGAFERPRVRVAGAAVVALGLVGGQVLIHTLAANRGSRAAVAAFAEAARPRHGGCLFVYDGWPALYRLTRTCLPTRFLFPGHLNTASEASARALGVDPSAEVERIFAAAPETVADVQPRYRLGNPKTAAIVDRHLARDYVLVHRLALPRGSVRLLYRRVEPKRVIRPDAPR